MENWLLKISLAEKRIDKALKVVRHSPSSATYTTLRDALNDYLILEKDKPL